MPDPSTAPATAPAEPAAAPPGERLVTLAVVAGAHGVQGEVRLRAFSDDLAAYPSLRAGGRTLAVVALRQGSNGPIARLAGIADRTAAEALRGVELQVPRAALPELGPGEYYHVDLIGLPCIATTGEALGHVVEVENFGAGDVIEIERAGGGRFMVPMRPEAVPEWDVERLVVDAAFVA